MVGVAGCLVDAAMLPLSGIENTSFKNAMTDTSAAAVLPDADTLRETLRAVMDPEAGMNIVDLGLVYDLAVGADGARVLMTMTSPACPLGDMIVDDVEAALRKVLPAGTRVEVELTFSPPWEPSMMSEAARRHFDW